MSGPNERDEVDGLVRLLARHVLTHVTPEHCTADCMARAILASDWLAERDRRVAGAALRETAEDFDLYLAENGVCMTCESNAVTAAEVWLRDRADRIDPPQKDREGGCGVCIRCDPPRGWATRMYLCGTCGNKRCPAAGDCHAWECSGSNEPGQTPIPKATP